MILHVDMDAFYASVEERDQPALVGNPVIVGGTPEGRGVVAAANYVARQYGVHSAMPASTAKRLCPDAVFLRPRMPHYAECSARIRQIFESYTPLVEPLSLDEAFLDVTGSELLHGSAIEIARSIKRDIKDDLQLVASVGVAPNKFLAKIASDLEKPNALVVVAPDHIQDFLDPLPVTRLWGVGRVTGNLFDQLGISTIRQLRQMPIERLQGSFGSASDHLWNLARGIDHRIVTPECESKSISHEKTFANDIRDANALHAWALELSEQVACRLRRLDLKARTIQLKVRFDDFHTVTRSRTLSTPTNMTREIWKPIEALLTDKLPARQLSVRLVGVGVRNLQRGAKTQLGLFDHEAHERDRRLDEIADGIKDKFGSSSLQRGSGILHNINPTPGPDEPNPNQFGE